MIPKLMFFDGTKADVIFQKEFEDGAICVLKYIGKNEKQHMTVSRLIDALDKHLRVADKTQKTFFKSINGENPKSPKVLSFKRGGRKHNVLYRQLFGEHDCALSNVIVWTNPLDVDITKSNVIEAPNGVLFDVIKKRRAMQAPETAQEQSDPEALAAFEKFELSVLPALESIRENEEEIRRLELMDFEESVAKGILPSPRGGVYFAWSPCLNCMKIGATRREDPHIRLRELSRFVTSPFILAAWLPTSTPFRLEAAAHIYFKEKRITAKGAGTEFFHVVEEEARGYVDMLMQ